MTRNIPKFNLLNSFMTQVIIIKKPIALQINGLVSI